jgi:hypothetical protein
LICANARSFDPRFEDEGRLKDVPRLICANARSFDPRFEDEGWLKSVHPLDLRKRSLV